VLDASTALTTYNTATNSSATRFGGNTTTTTWAGTQTVTIPGDAGAAKPYYLHVVFPAYWSNMVTSLTDANNITWYFSKSANIDFNYNEGTAASTFKHYVCVSDSGGSSPNRF